jgi:hypothetical protein
MRKIIVLSMISLDGVLQAPGGPEEDPSGGFKLGGWTEPYDDEAYSKVIEQEIKPAEYLLGQENIRHMGKLLAPTCRCLAGYQ